MSKESRISILNSVAEEKKQDCLKRTEKAISQLIKNHEKISFRSIAVVADVSISYLYKYPEIKERIQCLRQQQIKGVYKLNKPQTASEKSKQAIIEQLRNRIKILECERQEQTKQIQALTGRLYEMGHNQDLVERLKIENIQLSQANKELIKQLSSAHNDYQ